MHQWNRLPKRCAVKMPSVQFFGRRWMMASDDFLLPPIFEALFRAGWLIAASLLFWDHQDSWLCPESLHIYVYLAGAQVFAAAVIILCIICVLVSTRGTILQATPRKHMSLVLYIKTALVVTEIFWQGFGTVRIYFYQDECVPLELWHTLRTLLWVVWVMLFLLLLCAYSVYNPSGSIKHHPRRDLSDLEISEDVKNLFLEPTEKGSRRLHRQWFKRTKRCFCCISSNEESKEAYWYVAELLATYYGTVDVMPSDLFSALCLMRKKQRRLLALTGSTTETPPIGALVPYGCCSIDIPPMAINGVAKSPPPSSGDPIMTSKPKRVVVKRSPSIGVPAWMTPEDALHFLRFAWGCYGWPAYMMSHLCTGLCNLWSDIRCCTCLRGPSENVTGDNCCECHLATVKHLTKVPPEDLLFSCFENGFCRVPFYVALDHQTRSIMVVVRGTLSADDLLTDLTSVLEELPNGGGIFHRGVLRSAQRVLSMLDKPLADALARHPDYDLVTTGHSLGAAVAAVLAYFLRPRFPGVRCFAFSPPSGTVDETRGLAMRDFVMTVVVGDDMVPRLGHNQLEALNREMVSVLLQCDMAKDDLNSQGLRAIFCGIRMTPKLSSDPAKFEVMGAPTGKLAPSLEVKNPKPGVRPATIDEILDRALPTTKWPLMLTPGRILHIARTEHGYRMYWAAPEYFDHVVISPHMMGDHLPDVILHALRSVTSTTYL